MASSRGLASSSCLCLNKAITASFFGLSQRRCGDIRENAREQTDAHEDDPDLDLGPAAHLEVVVDGGHLEDPLAVGQAEIGGLDDDGQGLNDVNQTHQDQNFETFTEFFTPLWNRIVPFTEEINHFRQFLIDKKTFLEGYINAGNIG